MRMRSAIAAGILLTSSIGWAADGDNTPAPEFTKAGIKLSKETTYFTEPVREDGTVDYVAALNAKFGEGVTPENNAAVLIWQLIGYRDDLTEAYNERLAKRLGIESLPSEGTFLVGIDDFVKSLPAGQRPDELDRIYENQGHAMDRPWSPKQFPVINQWIDANQEPLTLVLEATKRERYFSPLVSSDDRENVITTFLPMIQECRAIARLLSARAMRSLGESDFDAATRDLLASHRLGRMVGQGPTIIEALVGIAIDSIASDADQALIASPKFGEKQLIAYREQLQSLPPLPLMREKIDLGERSLSLDAIQLLAIEGPQGLQMIGDGAPDEGIMGNIAEFFMKNGVDWNLVLTRFNKLYDRLTSLLQIKNRAARIAAINAFNEEMKKRRGEVQNLNPLKMLFGKGIRASVTEGMSVILESLLIPAVLQAHKAEERQTMKAEVTQIGFAIAAYQREHGEYPQSLADLKPKFFAEVPQDLFSGKPLIYQRTPDGFLLYSIGENETDDNGVFDYTGDIEKDDLAVRIPLPKDDAN
ncbi:hypothetical protein [Thalassoroseus pseudoceratinae]|uniref:hypothetical protein n=1 Tax=Thalassoroseus pseudoceratinae TaxID=2713176 RepID=UPI00141E7DA5|nr:hypothetical protein [Thalassoroseus pseudoceratinae]